MHARAYLGTQESVRVERMREPPATLIGRSLMEHAKRRQHHTAIGRRVFAARARSDVAREQFRQRRELIACRVVLILELAVHPPVRRHENRRIGMRAGRLRLDSRQRSIEAVGLQAVDGAFVTGRRQHQQVVRSVDRKVDGIERVAAHDPESVVLRPGVNALRDPVDEIERAMRIDRATAQGLETAGKSRDRGALRKGCRNDARRGAGDIEASEFPLAHEDPMSHVFDRILERILAESQKSGAVIAIAGRKAALRIHMNIAKAHVVRAIEPHRCRRWPQSASDAIPVIVRDQNVRGIADLE